MSKTDDLFKGITDRIVEAIETGNHGKWQKPWTTVIGGQGLAVNPTPKHGGYHGFNQLWLMFVTAMEGHSSNVWATYKQWKVLGGQVQKGEVGTLLVKWGKTYRCATCQTKGPRPCEKSNHDISSSMWASPFKVFNIDQQEGYEIEIPDLGDAPARLARVEEFIDGSGAEIRYEAQDQAYFDKKADRITLPLREQFDTIQGFYGTALHELTHWTGAESRLDRTMGRIFGDSTYAAEELVAELGATFIAAKFGIEVEPHQEHTDYLAQWIEMLRSHPKALYSAAKMAQTSTDYLIDLADGGEKEEAA